MCTAGSVLHPAEVPIPHQCHHPGRVQLHRPACAILWLRAESNSTTHARSIPSSTCATTAMRLAYSMCALAAAFSYVHGV